MLKLSPSRLSMQVEPALHCWAHSQAKLCVYYSTCAERMELMLHFMEPLTCLEFVAVSSVTGFAVYLVNSEI